MISKIVCIVLKTILEYLYKAEWNIFKIVQIKTNYVKSVIYSVRLCDPMDCGPPGSSVHGILQARIQEWVAIPFSRGSSQPKDPTLVSCIAGRFFTFWTTREAQSEL